MSEKLKVRSVLSAVFTKQLLMGSVLSVSIFGFMGSSFASKPSLTLEQSLQRTLDFHPALKVYDVKSKILQGQFKTAQLKPAYQLSIGLDNILGSGEFNGLSRSELTISLSSVIELGNKPSSRTQLVNQQQSLLQVKKQAESLDLLGLTTRRYINALSAQAYTELALDELRLAKSAHLLVNKRVKAGATAELEARRAYAAVVRAELHYLAEQQKLELAKVTLANSWGQREVGFSKLEGSLYLFGQDVGFEVLNVKIANNPVIQVLAADHRVKASEYRLAKVQSELDIDWQVGVRRFAESSDVALVSGLSIPLYSTNRSAGLIESAKAETEQITFQKEASLLSLHSQLYAAFSHRQQAILTVKQYQQVIVPELEKVLEETESAYQNGQYSYLEYITSRQELLMAKKALIESATAGLKYGLEIEQLIAEPLSVMAERENKKLGNRQNEN